MRCQTISTDFNVIENLGNSVIRETFQNDKWYTSKETHRKEIPDFPKKIQPSAIKRLVSNLVKTAFFMSSNKNVPTPATNNKVKHSVNVIHVFFFSIVQLCRMSYLK